MTDQQSRLLVLSLFPGIDLLGRGFELEGFCVVRGPDILWGGDIRSFDPPPGRFDGIIAGSPCQDFSRARRSPSTGYGVEMLSQLSRVVTAAAAPWFLLENVPTVPDISIDGYRVQRLDLNARECGARQNRPRHFQFGSRDGSILTPGRRVTSGTPEPAVLATEGRKKHRRTWAEFCELQGLPGGFDLPGMTLTARYSAVGNGVHVEVARTIARAIREALTRTVQPLVCGCSCGRTITGKQDYATAACRKRMERRRKRDATFAACDRSLTDGPLTVTVTVLDPA